MARADPEAGSQCLDSGLIESTLRDQPQTSTDGPVVDVPFRAGVPGATSGRGRRRRRKPAAEAAAAEGKNRTCRRLACGKGQIGRQ